MLASKQRERLLRETAVRISRSADIQMILDTTALEIQQFLQADRVLIYQFDSDMSGQVVAESVAGNWLPIRGQQIEDTCFQRGGGQQYHQGYRWVVSDVYQAGLTQCHLQLLERFQVRANLAVPIFVGDRLWGLLILHQCANAREWQSDELELVDHLTVYLTIALQQATLHQQLQEEGNTRKQAEERLQHLSERLELAVKAAKIGIWDWDVMNDRLFWDDRMYELYGVQPSSTACGYATWEARVHPDDLLNCRIVTQKSLAGESSYETNFRVLLPDDTIRHVESYALVQRSPDGAPVRMIGMNFDISERVRLETERKRAETALRCLVESTAAAIGKDFFSALAQQLMLALQVQYVLVTQLVGDRLQTLAYWKDGKPQSEIMFALADAPCCSRAIQYGQFYCPKDLLERFSDYPLIQSLQAESYLGIPLTTVSGQRVGNLCILDNKPMEDIQWAEAFLRIFATRAAAELERQHATEALECLNQELEDRVEQRTAALRESEAKLSAIFNQAAVGINLATLDGQYLKVNQKLCDILGYSKEELVTQNFREFCHPDDREKGEAERQQLYAGAINSFSIEKRCLHRNGSTVWINLTVSLIRQASGDVDCSIGIVEDISDRKRAEEALRQSEEKFRQLAENIQSVFWISDTDCSKILYVSPAYEDIWGCSRELLYTSPESFADAIHPDDQARVFEFLAKQSEGYDEEYRILRPDGTQRWVRDRAFPIHNPQGEVYRLAGIAEDITARKQSEEIVSRQLATIEAAIDGIAILNTKGEYTYLNQAHASLFGYRCAEELVGKTWKTLYSAAEVERFEQKVLPKLPEARAWRGEAIATRRDGSTFHQEVSLTLTPQEEMICICRDISERTRLETARRQAQQALEQSEEQFRTVFDNAPIAISLVRVDNYQIFRVNAAHYQLFGYSDAELAAMSISDLTHPDDLAEDIKQVEQMLRGEISGFQMEKRFITKKGDVILANMTVALISDPDGCPLYSMAMIEDITERKQSEMLLKAQQEFLRRLIDTVPNLIFVKDWQGRFTLVNQAMADIYQAKISDLVGKTNAEVHPNVAEVEQFLAVDREVMTTMMTRLVEETITDANGHQCYFQTIKTPIMSVDGHSQEILGVATDISDRKCMEEQLRQNEAWLLETQRIAHMGSWQLDVATQRNTWSEETFQIFGYAPEQPEPTYEELIQSVHPDDREQNEAVFKEAIAQVKPFELEYRVVHPDGSIIHVLVKGQPVLAETGDLLSFLGTVLDITDRKQFEEQLRQTNERLALINGELARATRLKDEFLANMSHELRTPLNAILGLAEGMKDQIFGEVGEQQMKALEIIENSGHHLLELINDILDIAKIESGQLDLNCAATAIEPLCQASLAFIKQQALIKDISLTIKLPFDLPDLCVDERRIRQVLINLLSNAVKFTPEGGSITLEVSFPGSHKPGLESRQFLRIAVIDTGIGIAPEHIHQLFQPFIQIDSALNRKYQGTGLGLALVKRIVELHGGQVELTSEVGVGSCFTIDLPCITPTPPVLKPPVLLQPEVNPSQLNQELSPLVLLAEDNEANTIAVLSYLMTKGYRTLSAQSGQEAISLAQAYNPDLILMDLQMPEMDGLEAIQQIRQDPNLVNVPIIALTALAMNGDRERCLAVGANDYITKPIKLKQLAELLATLLS
ncbi:PAS domain S-box protein [Leptolyngbya sp. FACHB-16]|uniref:PAS domain S-box protein n=2 Tax=Leptolyngbya TaxID=47251 RepID=UPI001684F21A|nr:PAS domain S-box protein [Leptolyngbya sp. FACHB-16]